VQRQQQTIDHLLEIDAADRAKELAKQSDWGSAAYYAFHLTYDRPSDFAYAAMGQRDNLPWKHRVRMLALEGQIYERDTPNPVVALVGRLDFSFLAAFILPLVLISVLYDLKNSERSAGRFYLLAATAGGSWSLWGVRSLVRTSIILFALLAPLLVFGLVMGTPKTTLGAAALALLVYGVFWAIVCYRLASLQRPSATVLASLLGVWLVFAIILPSAAKLTIDSLIPVPAGSEILLTQREAVNDAWDLPEEATMEPFIERHPRWAEHTAVGDSFEWKWYYAFQQVGDQKTEDLTIAYRQARLKRDQLAAWSSIVMPPALLERSLQKLAHTDVKAAMAYENQVREFHAQLREYYYPKLFLHQPFDKNQLANLPQFGSKLSSESQLVESNGSNQ
jgi:ABC-2 type transport system permease protein